MEPEEKPAKAKRKRKPSALGRSRVWTAFPPLMQPTDVITTLLPWLAHKPPPRRRKEGLLATANPTACAAASNRA
jgi:hypothetical protein